MIRSALALILLAAKTLSPAQNIADRDYTLTVDVELVQLSVSVLDKQGIPVPGLQQEHFTVYEDKVAQSISLFKLEDIPLSVGLVIDGSGSMTSKLDRLNTAAMTFVRESNPEDETSIVSFGDDVNLEQDFTTNTRKLSRALAEISPRGNTSLYDAILLAARHVEAQAFHEKKVLVVVSDGRDNHSKYKLKEVIEALRESKIILYSVGLLSPYEPGSSLFDDGKRALKQLAEVTGGASFFPKDVNEVEKICQGIARELRSQYTIGYRPSNEKLDGSWRKIQVRINLPKNVEKVKVRTKHGYYAPTRVENARGVPVSEESSRQSRSGRNADIH